MNQQAVVLESAQPVSPPSSSQSLLATRLRHSRLKVGLKVLLALGLGVAGGAVSPHATNVFEAAAIGAVITAVFAFMFLVKPPKGVFAVALPLLFTF